MRLGGRERLGEPRAAAALRCAISAGAKGLKAPLRHSSPRSAKDIERVPATTR